MICRTQHPRPQFRRETDKKGPETRASPWERPGLRAFFVFESQRSGKAVDDFGAGADLRLVGLPDLIL